MEIDSSREPGEVNTSTLPDNNNNNNNANNRTNNNEINAGSNSDSTIFDENAKTNNTVADKNITIDTASRDKHTVLQITTERLPATTGQYITTTEKPQETKEENNALIVQREQRLENDQNPRQEAQPNPWTHETDSNIYWTKDHDEAYAEFKEEQALQRCYDQSLRQPQHSGQLPLPMVFNGVVDGSNSTQLQKFGRNRRRKGGNRAIITPTPLYSLQEENNDGCTDTPDA